MDVRSVRLRLLVQVVDFIEPDLHPINKCLHSDVHCTSCPDVCTHCYSTKTHSSKSCCRSPIEWQIFLQDRLAEMFVYPVDLGGSLQCEGNHDFFDFQFASIPDVRLPTVCIDECCHTSVLQCGLVKWPCMPWICCLVRWLGWANRVYVWLCFERESAHRFFLSGSLPFDIVLTPLSIWKNPPFTNSTV